MDNVIEFLLGVWTENTIPNYLQMDNSASFIGNFTHSRYFSRVVRLCLHVGVEPVFIAPSKPWMNGKIEDFNGDFKVNLWEREQWIDLGHIQREAIIFLMRHNKRQEWMGRKIEMGAIVHRKRLGDLEINANSLPITEGKVHFIRQVKGDGIINVLNEDFDVGESLVNEYVWTTIDTKLEQLMIYYRGKDEEKAEIIKIYKYDVGESIEKFKDKF